MIYNMLALAASVSFARHVGCVTLYEGFMCGTTVLDKDGISAAVVTAEMTAYLASQGTSVLQHLSHLHDKSVHFFSQNFTVCQNSCFFVTLMLCM